MRIREAPFVDAARASGAGRSRMLLTHVLPHALTPAVVLATFSLAGAMLVTLMIIKANLEIYGRELWAVALLAFTGGNLPIIVIVGVMLAILPRILDII